MGGFMIRGIFFVVGSLFILFFSRRAIMNPEVHGFYRFFAFEGILILILINHPRWFKDPFSPLQCLSWFLLATSIFFVFHAIMLLKKHGGYAQRKDTPENHSFENTVRVVEEGLYRYVRHPMYSSLLFLAWGAFLKHITQVNIALIFMITIVLIVAAVIEENENIKFFGEAYKAYRRRSRMFIPWVF